MSASDRKNEPEEVDGPEESCLPRVMLAMRASDGLSGDSAFLRTI
jgi:hypothetical protein